MISKLKSVMEIIGFTMIIIGAILNKSQSFEISGVENKDYVRPRACYPDKHPNDACTNILEDECWNNIATFICCDEDQSNVRSKIDECCVDFSCNYITEKCFNNLLISDLLKENPCNNTNVLKIKNRARYVWKRCYNFD